MVHCCFFVLRPALQCLKLDVCSLQDKLHASTVDERSELLGESLQFCPPQKVFYSRPNVFWSFPDVGQEFFWVVVSLSSAWLPGVHSVPKVAKVVMSDGQPGILRRQIIVESFSRLQPCCAKIVQWPQSRSRT